MQYVCHTMILATPRVSGVEGFYSIYFYWSHTHVQGVKQSVRLSVVVIIIVGTKIARSQVLGVYACCKHNQSVDISEKLVFTCFKLLKMAY